SKSAGTSPTKATSSNTSTASGRSKLTRRESSIDSGADFSMATNSNLQAVPRENSQRWRLQKAIFVVLGFGTLLWLTAGLGFVWYHCELFTFLLNDCRFCVYYGRDGDTSTDARERQFFAQELERWPSRIQDQWFFSDPDVPGPGWC